HLLTPYLLLYHAVTHHTYTSRPFPSTPPFRPVLVFAERQYAYSAACCLARLDRVDEGLIALQRAWELDQAFVHAVEARETAGRRSEEHTSELQSHLNLVCRLLLAKKTGYITRL